MPAEKPQPAKSAVETEFENVRGETPGFEISIESEIENQRGGLDIAALQRLATVRALNNDKPDAKEHKTAAADDLNDDERKGSFFSRFRRS